MDEIGKSVRAIIALQLKIDSRELADDVEFVADLGLDSLDSIEIVIAL